MQIRRETISFDLSARVIARDSELIGVSAFPGMGEDDPARRHRQHGADRHPAAGPPPGKIGHRVALRRHQAQERHPDAGSEVPGQGDPHRSI